MLSLTARLYFIYFYANVFIPLLMFLSFFSRDSIRFYLFKEVHK